MAGYTPVKWGEPPTDKNVNQLILRDMGNTNWSFPILHNGYARSEYIYTARNNFSGGNVANWRRSDNSLMLQANDAGVAIGTALSLPFLTPGSVLFAGPDPGNIISQDGANLFYDDTNNRLGILTATPTQTLDIGGNLTVAGATGDVVSAGQYSSVLGAIVASTPSFIASQTWNDGAVNFKAFVLSITDTASAGASYLMDLQVGGVSKLTVDKFGDMVIAGSASIAGNVAVNTNKFLVDSITGSTFAAYTIASGLGTITDPVFMFDGSAVWNDVTDTFGAIRISITDTNSAAGSLFLSFLKGGVSQLSVRKDGVLTGLGLPVFNGGANLWYAPLIGACSGNLTLTASYTDVTGASVTLTALGKWLVTASVDFRHTGVGDAGQLLECQLALAAGATADNTGRARWADPSATPESRVTAFQQWIVTVASGTPTVKLQGIKSGGTGASVIVATHTKITATWMGNV